MSIHEEEFEDELEGDDPVECDNYEECGNMADPRMPYCPECNGDDY